MLPLSIICLQILMISLVKTQCCLTFSGRNCLTCPNGTHLFRGSCLNDIEQCLEYTGGFDCIKCASGYHLTNNSCLLWSGQSSSSSQSFTDKFIDYKNITK